MHFQAALAIEGTITVMVPEIVEGRATEAAAKLARTCIKPPWQELSLAMARALREELLEAGVTRLTIVAQLSGEEPELLVREPAEPEQTSGG